MLGNKIILDPLKKEKGYFYNKVSTNKEKILFVLPCNGGAHRGNYFLGSGEGNKYSWNNWRATDYYLRFFREEFFMAAISSVNLHFEDDNGALVFENEMHRVKSNNDLGKSNFSIYDKNKDVFNQDYHCEMLKKGLIRAMEEYSIKYFYFVINVLFYKYSLYKAINELNLWDRVTFCNVNIMGMVLSWIKMYPIIRNNFNSYLGILNFDRFNFINPSEEVKNKIEPYNFYRSNRNTNLEKEYINEVVIIYDKNTDEIFSNPIINRERVKFQEEFYGILPSWKVLGFEKIVDKYKRLDFSKYKSIDNRQDKCYYLF